VIDGFLTMRLLIEATKTWWLLEGQDCKSIWPLPQEKRLTHFVLIIIIAFSFTTNCVKSITDFTLDALNYVLNANYQLFAEP